MAPAKESQPVSKKKMNYFLRLQGRFCLEVKQMKQMKHGDFQHTTNT